MWTGIEMLFGTFGWAYLLTLPCGLSSNKIWRGVYIPIVLIFNVLMALMELVVAVKFQEVVITAHWMVVFNTNLAEAKEFIGNYFDAKLILLIVGTTFCFIFFYQILRYINRKRFLKKIAIPLSILGIVCMFLLPFNGLWALTGIGASASQIRGVFEFQSYNLAESQKPFKVTNVSSSHPQNIILIVGESFDKIHSNLYGYDKVTNPRLSSRLRDNSMVVFSNVSSPAPMTTFSIRQMFSLSDELVDPEWHTKPMLPTFMDKCGYNTAWISNQASKAWGDNILEQLSLLSKERCFTMADYMAHALPDSVVFEPFSRQLSRIKGDSNNFIVVHLMGSHISYNSRYPRSFSHFKESDYPDQPEERRETFATYDNSILYNDYVVDKLMAMSDSLDAIVIYLPDHGQDFFYTRDMASHGRMSVPESFEAGCRIPFMIYFTPKFRAAHPNVLDRVFQFKDKKFETKYLMNTIMELSGYDIVNSNSYGNSLFEGKLYK